MYLNQYLKQMKSLKNIIGLLLFTVFFTACKNETAPEVKTVELETTTEEVATLDPNATYAKAEFTIEGMTCAMGCAKSPSENVLSDDSWKARV